jgi:hypothetical protein
VPSSLRTGLVVVLVALPAGASHAASKPQHPMIKVIEATYGGNCQAAKGNVTRFVASECNDKDMCNYRVYYKNMEEATPSGCERNFSVRYTCGKNSRRYVCSVEAESGWGGEDGHANKFCILYCRYDR